MRLVDYTSRSHAITGVGGARGAVAGVACAIHVPLVVRVVTVSGAQPPVASSLAYILRYGEPERTWSNAAIFFLSLVNLFMSDTAQLLMSFLASAAILPQAA